MEKTRQQTEDSRPRTYKISRALQTGGYSLISREVEIDLYNNPPRPPENPTRLQTFGRVLSTGGLSLIFERSSELATTEQSSEVRAETEPE